MPKTLLIIPNYFRSSQKDAIKTTLLAIAECNFQARVLTTYDENAEFEFIHKNIEIVQPFKKWNIFEMGNIVKAIYGFRPDVVHYIFDPEFRSSSTVALAIPAILQGLARPKYIVQLQGELPDNVPLVFRYWLQLSENILVEDDFSKLKVSALKESHRKQKIYVLEGGESRPFDETENHWINDSFEKFIYACGEIKSLAQLEESINCIMPFLNWSKKHAVVFHLSAKLNSFLSSSGYQKLLRKKNLSRQVVLLHNVDSENNKMLLKNCSMVSLAHLDFGAKEIAYTVKIISGSNKNVILRKNQLEFEKSLSNYLAKAITPEQLNQRTFNLDEHQQIPPPSDIAPLDRIGNQLSRIYQSLISH